jgi:hypothetical protein
MQSEAVVEVSEYPSAPGCLKNAAESDFVALLEHAHDLNRNYYKPGHPSPQQFPLEYCFLR